MAPLMHIYSSYTALVPDIDDDLERATGLVIERGYPGGRDLLASFSVARDVTRPWQFRAGHRLEIREGATCIFNGKIANIADEISRGRQGNRVEAIGDWGDVLMLRRIQKYWADNRITTQVWREWEGPYPKCSLSRSNGALRMTPKGDFAMDEVAYRCRYTMPTGETIKRVMLDYSCSRYAEWRPQGMMHYDSSAVTYIDIADDDNLTLDTGDWLYIWGREELLNMSGIRVEMSAVNNNAAVLDVEVYSTAWGNVAGLVDGLDNGGATFGQSGDILFTEIKACKETEVNGKSGRFMRLGVSAILDNVTVTKVAFLMQQNWKLRLRDRDGMTDIWSVIVSGAGTRDDTLGTARQHLEIQLVSSAAQNAPSNGSIFGEISNIMMYSETGGINLTEIAKDIQGAISRLNTYQGYINANGFEITPFISDWLTAADVLVQAADKGDGSGASWAYGLLPPDYAAAPDGKPVLFVEAFPVLTAWDYSIGTNDQNLDGGLILEDEIYDTRNYLLTSWNGEDGITYWISPLDDSTLRDAESDDLYGRKDDRLELGQASLADVLAETRRYLAAHKGRAGYVSSPIVVRGWIYDSSGCQIPAACIMPGKRLRLRNYADDGSGAWRIYLIVHIRYDADADICAITVDKGGSQYGI